MPDGTITITKPSSCAPGATINVALQNDGNDYGGRSWTIFPSASAGTFSQSSLVIGDATNGNPPSVTITWTAPATPQTVTFGFYTLPDGIAASFGGSDCSQDYDCSHTDYQSTEWNGSVEADTCAIWKDELEQWRMDVFCSTVSDTDQLSASATAYPNRPPESAGAWSYDTNLTGNDFNGLTHTESTTFAYSPADTVVVAAMSNAHAAFLAFLE